MDAATMKAKLEHLLMIIAISLTSRNVGKFIENLIASRMKVGKPRAHLLTFLTSGAKALLSRPMLLDGDHGPDEVTLFVTGFIESKRTALFHNNNQALDPKRAFLQKQILTLTGFGSRLFEQSIECLHELITMFERSYPEHAIETWDLPTATIQALNRYFTRGSDTGALNILDLDRNIDPYGILAAAAKGRYVYTEDNKINCFQMLGKPHHQFPEEAYVQFYKDSDPEGTSMTLENGDEEVQNDDQSKEEYQWEFENAGKGMRHWSVG
ncbi:hypothetical protein C8J56DRAFT_1039114 [Mycena floridula]|nr:hypothetical protein C8J56DRAFT_1039114 [Mycena floridula]